MTDAEARALDALDVIDRRSGFENGGRDSTHPAVCRAYRDLAAALAEIYGPFRPVPQRAPRREITRQGGAGFLGLEVVPRPLSDFLSPDRTPTRPLQLHKLTP